MAGRQDEGSEGCAGFRGWSPDTEGSRRCLRAGLEESTVLEVWPHLPHAGGVRLYRAPSRALSLGNLGMGLGKV